MYRNITRYVTCKTTGFIALIENGALRPHIQTTFYFTDSKYTFPLVCFLFSLWYYPTICFFIKLPVKHVVSN